MPLGGDFHSENKWVMQELLADTCQRQVRTAQLAFQLERELGRSVPMDEASEALVEAFCGVFEREAIVA